MIVARHRDLLTTGAVRPRLLAIPALVAMAPFAAGLKNPGLETATALVIGYLATGIHEELWFRGVVLKSLEAWSPLRAALLSSALFGLAHLSNITFGANPAVTAAQVVGATCFGIGLAALRLQGVSFWPLILIHTLADIALQFGDMTAGLRWTMMIGTDTALLILGVFILRQHAKPPALKYIRPDSPAATT